MIEVQKRKVKRSGYNPTYRYFDADGTLKCQSTTEQWCIIEDGKVIAEARSLSYAKRIRTALWAVEGKK